MAPRVTPGGMTKLDKPWGTAHCSMTSRVHHAAAGSAPQRRVGAPGDGDGGRREQREHGERGGVVMAARHHEGRREQIGAEGAR